MVNIDIGGYPPTFSTSSDFHRPCGSQSCLNALSLVAQAEKTTGGNIWKINLRGLCQTPLALLKKLTSKPTILCSLSSMQISKALMSKGMFTKNNSHMEPSPGWYNNIIRRRKHLLESHHALPMHLLMLFSQQNWGRHFKQHSLGSQVYNRRIQCCSSVFLPSNTISSQTTITFIDY